MTGTESLRADTPGHAKLYFECDMREIDILGFCGGTAAVFSMSNPATSGANEDAAALIPHDASSGALVVADGAGGLRGGGQASNITVKALKESLENSGPNTQPLRESILGGIEQANRTIGDLAIGAATTVAVAEIQGTKLRPYHAGDTQILVFGIAGDVKHLTVSHSPTGYAVQMGLLDERQAMVHEDRHLLFNVVGIPDMRIEMGMEVDLVVGDTVVIACDGLFDNLAPDEVVEMMRQGSIASCTRTLIETCLGRMGGTDPKHPCKPDDLTVVAYRFGE